MLYYQLTQPALPSIPAPRREPKGHPGTRGWSHAVPAPAHSPCAAPKPVSSRQEHGISARSTSSLPCSVPSELHRGHVPSVLGPFPAGGRAWIQKLSAPVGTLSLQQAPSPQTKLGTEQGINQFTRQAPGTGMPSTGKQCMMPFVPSSFPRGSISCENSQLKL